MLIKGQKVRVIQDGKSLSTMPCNFKGVLVCNFDPVPDQVLIEIDEQDRILPFVKFALVDINIIYMPFDIAGTPIKMLEFNKIAAF